MLLIVGAEGYLGQKTIQQLLYYQHSNDFCLLTTQLPQQKNWIQHGLQAKCIPASASQALYDLLRNCETVLFLSHGHDPQQIKYEKHLIDLAAQADIDQIFYAGFALQNIEHEELNGLAKAQMSIQHYLENSGVSYRLIHRSMCAEAIPTFIGQHVLEHGVLVSAGDGKVPYVRCDDVAKAIANIVSHESPQQKNYYLTGNRAYSYRDIAKILSRLAQKTVHYIDADRAVYRQKLLDLHLSAHEVTQRLATMSDVKAHRYEVQSDDLNRILGHAHFGMSDYLQRCYSL